MKFESKWILENWSTEWKNYRSVAYEKQFGIKHNGTDYAAKKGTKLYALESGIATVGFDKSYGNYVIIDYKNYSFFYAHLDKTLINKKEVKRGDVIGTVGNTGFSTGDHLHFEILKFESNVQATTKNSLSWNIKLTYCINPYDYIRDQPEEECNVKFNLTRQYKLVALTDWWTYSDCCLIVKNDSKMWIKKNWVVYATRLDNGNYMVMGMNGTCYGIVSNYDIANASKYA